MGLRDMAARTDGLTAPRLLLLAAAIALGGCSATSGVTSPGSTTGGDDTESSYIGSTTNLASLGEVVQRNPNDPQAFNMRGTVLARTGRNAEALADFSRAIQIDPNYAQALANRALVHRRMGRLDQALADYNRAITADQNYAAAYVGRGNIYRAQNRQGEALADYNRAIQINGSDAQAYHNRALVWAAQGNHRQAVEDFTTALGLAPNNAEPYYGRGLSYLALGDAKSALDDFNEAVQFEQRNADLWVARGQALERTGDNERALGSYTKAISIEENHPGAREGFNRLGGRAGQTYRLFNWRRAALPSIPPFSGQFEPLASEWANCTAQVRLRGSLSPHLVGGSDLARRSTGASLTRRHGPATHNHPQGGATASLEGRSARPLEPFSAPASLQVLRQFHHGGTEAEALIGLARHVVADDGADHQALDAMGAGEPLGLLQQRRADPLPAVPLVHHELGHPGDPRDLRAQIGLRLLQHEAHHGDDLVAIGRHHHRAAVARDTRQVRLEAGGRGLHVPRPVGGDAILEEVELVDEVDHRRAVAGLEGADDEAHGSRSRCGATTARVWSLGTTGTISKVTPEPRQDSTHSCSRRASSHSISWKQRSKFGSIQLPT